MADRRGVRAASRRKTPTPQPPSKANTPQAGRASRTRGLRSASRDIEDVTDVKKPTRRSARQASVTTVTDESDHEGRAARKTKRKAAKAPVDLTTVEEIDTQIALDEGPGTPSHVQTENALLYRSPGAASEMSGTTAISSFSMVEAEFLEPKYILKHMRKLCDSAEEFLEHIAPSNPEEGVDSREVDMRNINDIQKPDSEFTQDYRDFDMELNIHLQHYKSDDHNYIHVRAIHRALFASNGDVAAAQSGLDMILYLTNLLIFAKQIMPSDRSEKYIWDVLRQLDNSFPNQFMRSLVPGSQPIASGESALFDSTYDLALDLRTQLAILVLQRSFSKNKLNSDELIEEVFFRSDFSQEERNSFVRGWSVSVDRDREATLPPKIRNLIVQRINNIRAYFPTDDESLEQGYTARLESLANDFPWTTTVMRILHWTRLRHRELHTAIEEVGGPALILRNVKEAMNHSQPSIEQVRAASIVRDTPRKKRTSFGRGRRRSSRKFDPNAPVDLRTIDALKAREQDPEIYLEVDSIRQEQEDPGDQTSQQTIEQVQNDLPVVDDQQNDWQPVLEDDQQHLEEQQNEEVEEQQIKEVEEQQIEEIEEHVEEPEVSGPPTNPADLLKALKAVSNPQKENRPVSIFDRQTTAQRVEFGDGFDETQPTPGPSSKGKGKQPALPSPRKRPRPIELEDGSDDDAFETEERGARVQEQRRKAPVAKKVRIDPTSSGAPPSHQPRRDRDDDYAPRRQEQEESVSEASAPDMTEEAPPSTYQSQHRLALQNSGLLRATNSRKPRTAWSNEEEEAFVEYMGIYPAKYATILKYDHDEGGQVLRHRTQVNLKDKARTMAINMIKSGTGLRPGFEEIVKPMTKDGKLLIANGFEW